jgi:hypothetical protein
MDVIPNGVGRPNRRVREIRVKYARIGGNITDNHI